MPLIRTPVKPRRVDINVCFAFDFISMVPSYIGDMQAQPAALVYRIAGSQIYGIRRSVPAELASFSYVCATTPNPP